MRGVAAIVAVSAAIGFSYGMYSSYTQDSVFRFLVQSKRSAENRVQADFRLDPSGRLINYPKREIDCPAQTARTMVAVVFGQSNAANGLGQRYAGKPNVVNYFGGKCFAAADPLLGNDGIQGSQWVVMANLLTGFDHIILIPMAVGGTAIRDWTGRLDVRVSGELRALKPRYTATHFLWHQGEGDVDTDPKIYAAELRKLIARTREAFPDSAFYVSVATHCDPRPDSEAIRQAQRSVVDPAERIFQGPNTDQFVALEDRLDGCHLSGPGQEKTAREWVRLVR